VFFFSCYCFAHDILTCLYSYSFVSSVGISFTHRDHEPYNHFHQQQQQQHHEQQQQQQQQSPDDEQQKDQHCLVQDRYNGHAQNPSHASLIVGAADVGDGEEGEVGDTTLHAALNYMFDHPNTTNTLVTGGASYPSSATTNVDVASTDGNGNEDGNEDGDQNNQKRRKITDTNTIHNNRSHNEEGHVESHQNVALAFPAPSIVTYHKHHDLSSGDHHHSLYLHHPQDRPTCDTFQNNITANAPSTILQFSESVTENENKTMSQHNLFQDAAIVAAQPRWRNDGCEESGGGKQLHSLDSIMMNNGNPHQPSLKIPALDGNNSSALASVQQNCQTQLSQQQQQQQQQHKHSQAFPPLQMPIQQPTAFATTVPLTMPNANNHIHHHVIQNHDSKSWGSDQITEARRRMNILIQQQQSAHDELRASEEALKQAQSRLEMAKKNIEIIAASVSQSTEELTDALLQEPTNWNAMYYKLVEYKEKYGTINVKRSLAGNNENESEVDPDHVKLGIWIGKVRAEARRPAGHPDVIEPYKIIALNRLGFDWDPRENYWMERFKELKIFLAAGGPKPKMPNRKTPLGVWCDGQVLEYNKFKAGVKPCYISKERIDMLESIGFIWDRQQAAWMNHYNTLKQRHLNFGSCFIPSYSGDKTLVRWIAKQKTKYKNFIDEKKPALTEEQVTLLNDIKFFDSTSNGKKYSLSGGKVTKALKARGRPKATTLLPPEAKDLLNEMTHDANETNINSKQSSELMLEPFHDLQSAVNYVSNHSMLQNETLGEAVYDSKNDLEDS